MSIYSIPSVYAHILNGFLLLLAIILLFRYIGKIRNLEPYKLIILTLFFSISIGIHGLSHLGLEKGYGYNPMNIFYALKI